MHTRLFYVRGLLEVQLVEDLGTVCIDDCQNTADIVGLVIPVAGNDLNIDFLTFVGFQESILICVGAIQTNLGGAVGHMNGSVVAVALDNNGTGHGIDSGGKVLLDIQIVEICNGDVALEAGGGVSVVAVVVYNNGSFVQASLTIVIGAALGVDVADAFQNYLVTDF